MKDLKSKVPALERGLDILALLEKNPAGLNFSGLLSGLKIPKPSLSRILLVLQQNRYIRQEDRVYKLGFKLLSLGTSVQNGFSLSKVARPHLEELLKETDETVELSILDNDCILTIDKLESFVSPIRLFSRLGGFFENVHSFAHGKVALAFIGEERAEKWINEHGLVKVTPFTITSATALKKELLRIRSGGYGSDFQEARLEVSRVAAPIFGTDKKLEGMVDVAGPFFRMNRKTKSKYAAAVKKCAGNISKELGYEKY